jgi:hypothetical protein
MRATDRHPEKRRGSWHSGRGVGPQLLEDHGAVHQLRRVRQHAPPPCQTATQVEGRPRQAVVVSLHHSGRTHGRPGRARKPQHPALPPPFSEDEATLQAPTERAQARHTYRHGRRPAHPHAARDVRQHPAQSLAVEHPMQSPAPGKQSHQVPMQPTRVARALWKELCAPLQPPWYVPRPSSRR